MEQLYYMRMVEFPSLHLPEVARTGMNTEEQLLDFAQTWLYFKTHSFC